MIAVLSFLFNYNCVFSSVVHILEIEKNHSNELIALKTTARYYD